MNSKKISNLLLNVSFFIGALFTVYMTYEITKIMSRGVIVSNNEIAIFLIGIAGMVITLKRF